MMQRIATLSKVISLVAISLLISISVAVDSIPFSTTQFAEHVKVDRDAQQFQKPIQDTDNDASWLHFWSQEADCEEMEKFLNGPACSQRSALGCSHVNIQSKDGFSPLHHAVLRATPEEMMDEERSRRRVRTIQLLLQKFANPHLREHRHDLSPFHLATLFSTPAIVQLLLDHDSDCRQQIKSKKSFTEIHRELLVEKLYNMRLGAYDRDIAPISLINSRDMDGNTALILLAKISGSKSETRILEMTSFLLAQSIPADATLLNHNGKSAISIATLNGNVEMLKLLLNSISPLSKRETLVSLLQTVPFDHDSTLLHLWAQAANDKMLEVFLGDPAFPKLPPLALQVINAQSKDGFSPLHHAVLRATPEEMMDEERSRHRIRTIQLLLQKSANPRLREHRHDRSPFHVATLFSTPVIVKLLLDHDTACRKFITDRFYTMEFGDYDDDIATIPLINSRDTDGNTALILLAKVSNSKHESRILEMTSFLLAQNNSADATLLNKNGASAFTIATLNGNAEMLKLLLSSINSSSREETLASLLQTVPFDHDSTLLHLWAQDANDKMMEVFLGDSGLRPDLAHGYINAQSKDGFSPLHHAVLRATPEELMDEERSPSRVRTIKLLLQKFADPRLREHSHDLSPFHLATLVSTPAIVELLLEHDSRWRTMITNEFFSIELSDRGDDNALIPLINSRDMDGNTALILLAKSSGSKSEVRILEMTSFLLSHPSPADATLFNKNGESAIAIAASNENVEMLKILLNCISQIKEKRARIFLLQNARQAAESRGKLQSISLISNAEEKITEFVRSKPSLPANTSNVDLAAATVSSSLKMPTKYTSIWKQSRSTCDIGSSVNKYMKFILCKVKLGKPKQK